MGFSSKTATLFCVMTLVGCTTKIISINAGDNAAVGLVSFNDLSKVEKTLGKTPVQFPLKDLVGKGIKVSADGKQPVYWLVAEATGNRTDLNVTLLDEVAAKQTAGGGMIGRIESGGLNQATVNRVLRLSINAYKELGRQRYDEAKQIAEQASQLAPEAAPPFVIKGVALAKTGNMNDARAAFIKARSLDPEDSDIPKLMAALGIQ